MSITRSGFIFKRCTPCGHADNGEQMPYPFPGFHICSPFFNFDCITISIPLLTDISASSASHTLLTPSGNAFVSVTPSRSYFVPRIVNPSHRSDSANIDSDHPSRREIRLTPSLNTNASVSVPTRCTCAPWATRYAAVWMFANV